MTKERQGNTLEESVLWVADSLDECIEAIQALRDDLGETRHSVESLTEAIRELSTLLTRH